MASDHRYSCAPAVTPPEQRRERLFRPVDPMIWRACAGTSVEMLSVDSRVYYFPQGHMEQSSAFNGGISLSYSSLHAPLMASMIPCLVSSVLFLANRDTDEVFARIGLVPAKFSTGELVVEEGSRTESGYLENRDAVVSFAKVLTPSDANNGGGFSVPRYCADSVFPPLDYQADPPVQNITITDIQGQDWDFRHIYRGTPRRHLLTTGWSKFVNSKKLIAGDSVVFMRDRLTNKLYVGIRRVVKSNDCRELGYWASKYAKLKMEEGIREAERNIEGSFSRSGKGKIPVEAVVEAAERAASGLPFEVVHYPKAGSPDFVVAAEKVESALSVRWTGGMRVKMAVETEDSSRVTWYQGKVSSVLLPDGGLWRGSPWRMLQVAWDDPDILQNVKRVNPWQLEYAAPMPPIHTPFPPAQKFRVPRSNEVPTTPILLSFPPPAKKLRVSPSNAVLINGEEDFPLLTSGFNNQMIGPFSSSFLNFNTFPAGMQGARQNPFLVPSLPNILVDNAHQMCPDGHIENITQKAEAVFTDLNVGSSPSDSPSFDSPSRVQFFGSGASGYPACDLSRKTGTTTIQLFGKIIHVQQPLCDPDDNGGTEYKGCGDLLH